MKVRNLIMLLIMILFLHGCASTEVKVTGMADSDQKVFYDGTITSEKKHAVTLSLYEEIELAKDKTIFMVVVENSEDYPISISSESVSVMFEAGSRRGAPRKINIQSLDDFMKDLEEEYYVEEGRIIKDIFRRASKTSDDIDRAHEDYQKEFAASRFETKFFNDMYKLVEMRKHYDQLEFLIPEIIIKKRTIPPGDSINAIVVCDTRDMDAGTNGDFKIKVTIDGEEHRFTFRRASS